MQLYCVIPLIPNPTPIPKPYIAE